MKTATITWITYNNYGTELQAYALQQFLENLDVENDIISDEYIIHESSMLKMKNTGEVKALDQEKAVIKEKKWMKCKRRIKKYFFHPIFFGKQLYRIFLSLWDTYKNIWKSKKFEESQRLFEEFKKNELKIVYGLKRKEMPFLNQKYNAFLCGSDQIWSVFEKNFDGYFYLDFAKGKKISYAASIGTEKIDQEHADQISTWLSDYSAISVREKRTSIQLSEILNREIEWVADPTLLHDRKFWSGFCHDVAYPKGKYLLCYFLSNQSWYFDYAKALAKDLKLRVLLIPSRPEYIEKKTCYKHAVGPKEFVSLIEHAQFVLTDSYHGSIFSLQFEKKFLYLKRFSDDDPENQNIRIFSLFQELGLMGHMVEKKMFSEEDIKQMDYCEINNIITSFRKKSAEFLRKELKE